MLVLADLSYLGTPFETPLKKPRKTTRSLDDKAYNKWHAGLRIGVEHAIGRMKKFRIFADIARNIPRVTANPKKAQTQVPSATLTAQGA